MKQLKFMLAAATAVGTAAVAQAATQTNYLFGDDTPTDTFEGADKDTLGRTLTGWSYSDLANAEQDDDSRVALDGEDKVLNVNTGTKPLLRALWQGDNGARPVSLADVQSLYIDTMVQFTVTPDGDTVTAGDGDKLMIYLKEVPAEGETPASTKLMVKAAKYTPGMPPTFVPTFDVGDFEIVNATVQPNTWYRLKVSSYVENGIALFTIKLDDTELIASEALYDAEKKVFPSMQGLYNEDTNPEANSLTYVGFAGEGVVDDLTVATITEQTSVDFTFTLSWGDGISAVTYTIDGDVTGAKTPENGKAFTVPGTGSFTISYELDGWYTLNDANPTLSYDFAPNGSGSLNLATTKLTSKEENGNVVVNPDATAAEVQAAAGITEGAFSDANTSKDDLQKALNWKKNCNGNNKADINKITFNGVEPTSDEAEAYLLNCDPEELATAKQEFKFSAEDLAELFDLTKADPALSIDNKYNGTVILEGKGELSGQWEVRGNGHKFFRARLVK